MLWTAENGAVYIDDFVKVSVMDILEEDAVDFEEGDCLVWI